jgi:hypothetical protein
MLASDPLGSPTVVAAQIASVPTSSRCPHAGTVPGWVCSCTAAVDCLSSDPFAKKDDSRTPARSTSVCAPPKKAAYAPSQAVTSACLSAKGDSKSAPHRDFAVWPPPVHHSPTRGTSPRSSSAPACSSCPSVSARSRAYRVCFCGVVMGTQAPTFDARNAKKFSPARPRVAQQLPPHSRLCARRAISMTFAVKTRRRSVGKCAESQVARARRHCESAAPDLAARFGGTWLGSAAQARGSRQEVNIDCASDSTTSAVHLFATGALPNCDCDFDCARDGNRRRRRRASRFPWLQVTARRRRKKPCRPKRSFLASDRLSRPHRSQFRRRRKTRLLLHQTTCCPSAVTQGSRVRTPPDTR